MWTQYLFYKINCTIWQAFLDNDLELYTYQCSLNLQENLLFWWWIDWYLCQLKRNIKYHPTYFKNDTSCTICKWFAYFLLQCIYGQGWDMMGIGTSVTPLLWTSMSTFINLTQMQVAPLLYTMSWKWHTVCSNKLTS